MLRALLPSHLLLPPSLMGLPEVGRLLPPEAVVHALLLALIYRSPLPQTRPRLPRLLSEVACQLRLGGGGRGGATEQMEPAFTSPPQEGFEAEPSHLSHSQSDIPKQNGICPLLPPRGDRGPVSATPPSYSPSAPTVCQVWARAEQQRRPGQ